MRVSTARRAVCARAARRSRTRARAAATAWRACRRRPTAPLGGTARRLGLGRRTSARRVRQGTRARQVAQQRRLASPAPTRSGPAARLALIARGAFSRMMRVQSNATSARPAVTARQAVPRQHHAPAGRTARCLGLCRPTNASNARQTAACRRAGRTLCAATWGSTGRSRWPEKAATTPAPLSARAWNCRWARTRGSARRRSWRNSG